MTNTKKAITFREWQKRQMIIEVYKVCGKSKGLYFEKFATETVNWSMIKAMYNKMMNGSKK